MRYILAHDVGTGGVKSAIVDQSSNIVESIQTEYPTYYPEKSCAEQDPMDWWNAVVSSSKKLLDISNIDPSDIISLVFSCQTVGTLPIGKDGDAMMRCMIWLDSRAEDEAKKLWKGLIKVSGCSLPTIIKFLRITGGAPGTNGKDVICKIMWLKDNEPDLYSTTHKFLGCKDYLLYRCTGNFVTSYDDADVTWMMDIKRLDWSDSILKKYGIDRKKLPDIKKPTDIAGKLKKDAAEELGLKEGIPVIMGAFDIPSAAIGSGAVLGSEIHICLGTSSWVACHLPKRKTDIFHYIGTICSANPDMYLCVSEQELASGCIDWIKDNVVAEKSYGSLNNMASNVDPGSNGLIFTPWLFGERSPINDPTVRCGFHNINLSHTKEDLVKSVMEGVAFNLKWALYYVERLSGTASEINIVGGGTLLDSWCQVLADVLCRKINRIKNPREATARGAAIIALIALGYINFDDVPRLVTVDKEFRPDNKNKKTYEDLFEEFKKIYRYNKKIYRDLNKQTNEE